MTCSCDQCNPVSYYLVNYIGPYHVASSHASGTHHPTLHQSIYVARKIRVLQLVPSQLISIILLADSKLHYIHRVVTLHNVIKLTP